MAESETPARAQPDDGPYLAIAVLCEKVLDEKDGTLSIIRVVDRVTVGTSGAGVPPVMPPVSVNLTVVLSFRSGRARGRGTIVLRSEKPDGQRLPQVSLPVLFEGEDRGVNVVTNIAMTADLEGLYWFDVLLEDKLVTRIPLRLVYQPVTTGGPGTPA